MANAKWFFRGVKGDQVGPVSSDTMYSLFAQGTLHADTHVAAAASTGEPDTWVEAIEVAAFRQRIEARGTRAPKSSKAREAEVRNVITGSDWDIDDQSGIHGVNQRREGKGKRSTASALSFVDPSFRSLITPQLAKLIWVFTLLLGCIWIAYNIYNFFLIISTSTNFGPDGAVNEDAYRHFKELQIRAYLGQYGANVLLGIVSVLSMRMMLEVTVVFFRIGKVLGCTEGEPSSA
jgi:hypothetical protein